MVLLVGHVQLDDWVLCRIYNKKGTLETRSEVGPKQAAPRLMMDMELEEEELKPAGRVTAPPRAVSAAPVSDFTFSDSMPRLHTSDSSCSEHVASTGFRGEREVQSEPRWREWEAALDTIPFTNNMDALVGPGSCNSFFSQLETPQIPPFLNSSSFQDLFYLQKPF